MDPQTTLLVLLGLATLAFFVFTYFAAKTWTITHVIMTVFVYFAAVFFAWMVAATLKTQQAWKETAHDLEVAIANEKLKTDLLKKGMGEDPAGNLKDLESLKEADAALAALAGKKSELQLASELERQIADRGRVWRGCTPTGGAAGGYTLSTAAPAAEGAPAPTPNQFKPKMVVYAFREVDFPSAADPMVLIKVPGAYLGEFTVSAATDTSVTLNPTSNDPSLRAQLAQAGTWTLYESMPGDRDDAFKDVVKGINDNDVAAATTALRAYLPKPAGVNDAAYETVIGEYARHLVNATPDASDPPENVWLKVKFVKPFKLKVDDEADTKGVEAYFQSQGLTMPMFLRREGKAEVDIDVGAEKAIIEPKARELISQGVAKEVGPVFVRKLRDYSFLFRQIDLARKLNQDLMGVVTRDTKTVTDSGDKLKKEVDYRTIELSKLTTDQARFVAEKKVIDDYYGKLMALRKKMQDERVATANNIVQMGQKLATLQKEMADRIDEQTRQAAAATPSTVPMTP